MKTSNKCNNDTSTKEQEALIQLKYGNSVGVYKKSLRPTKSLKPFSFAPRKIKTVSKVQRTSPPLERSPESV